MGRHNVHFSLDVVELKVKDIARIAIGEFLVELAIPDELVQAA